MTDTDGETGRISIEYCLYFCRKLAHYIFKYKKKQNPYEPSNGGIAYRNLLFMAVTNHSCRRLWYLELSA